MDRVIEYYKTDANECPVMEFIDSLPKKERAKVFWVLRLIAQIERPSTEYFKKLTNAEGIWEARIQTSGNALRSFSFFHDGDKIVLTHGYSKKSQRTDSSKSLGQYVFGMTIWCSTGGNRNGKESKK